MTKIEKSEAIVLKSKKYGETSKITTFYTKRYGKINGIIKGARKNNNKFGSSLESLSYVTLVLYKKENTSLHLIANCDLLNSFKSISESLEKLSVAMKIAELIIKIAHDEEENPKLFKLFLDSLKILDKENTNLVNILYSFEIKLGELLGYMYNFSTCSKCGENIAKDHIQYIFDYSRGGTLCQRCSDLAVEPVKISIKNLKILEKFEKTNDIKKLLNIVLTPLSEVEIGKFLFDYLRYHISELRELKSEFIFRKII